MRKTADFDRWRGLGWPSVEELRPYFFSAKGKEWFSSGGNDTAGLRLEGVDGTDHLPYPGGRKDIRLSMWGVPGLGVLLIHVKTGHPSAVFHTSKGDLRRLGEIVVTLHSDPMPVGLFIPFDRAFAAVKEFIETEGALPTCIEWINNKDLPAGTFPDP